MADLFLIKGETLKATADKIREHLNLENYSVNPEVVANERAIRWLKPDSVWVDYREFIDDPNGCYDGQGKDAPFGDSIVAYTYLENNEGIIVPVLYKTSNADPDTEEPLFYVGEEDIDGEIYDKWRKIETQSWGDDGFRWDTEARQYIYTNPIVTVNSNVDGIIPYRFPSKIDEVYGAGYDTGYAKGQEGAMPTLSEAEGTEFGYDVYVDDQYIISSETLNSIVTKMSDISAGYTEDGEPWTTSTFPEDIPHDMQYICDTIEEKSYDNGFVDGNDDALSALLAERTCGAFAFYGMKRLTNQALIHYLSYIPSVGTSTNSMFYSCSKLTTVPLLDTSNATVMTSMFSLCTKLTTVPLFDTSNVAMTDMMFSFCTRLTTVPSLDLRKVTSCSNMFLMCYNLTDIRLRNIKQNLQVGSGTDWGHLLTVDSLVHLIYELRDIGWTNILTVGSANLEKLANVYVKLVNITEEMRAEDDLIDEKLPFVVCESTDAEAILITDYVSAKNWSLQ